MKKEYFIIKISNIREKLKSIQNTIDSNGNYLLKDYFTEIPNKIDVIKQVAEIEVDSVVSLLTISKEENRRDLKEALVNELSILESLGSMLNIAEIYGVEFE